MFVSRLSRRAGERTRDFAAASTFFPRHVIIRVTSDSLRVHRSAFSRAILANWRRSKFYKKHDVILVEKYKERNI